MSPQYFSIESLSTLQKFEMEKRDDDTCENKNLDKVLTEGLEMELRTKDEKIRELEKRLVKSEKQIEKLNNYNADLRKELTNISSKLHDLRSKRNCCVDVSTQVFDCDTKEGLYL